MKLPRSAMFLATLPLAAGAVAVYAPAAHAATDSPWGHVSITVLNHSDLALTDGTATTSVYGDGDPVPDIGAHDQGQVFSQPKWSLFSDTGGSLYYRHYGDKGPAGLNWLDSPNGRLVAGAEGPKGTACRIFVNRSGRDSKITYVLEQDAVGDGECNAST